MLLCGADVLASMAVPGVWLNLETLLEEFGVVCLDRGEANLRDLFEGRLKEGAGASSFDPGAERPTNPNDTGSARALRDLIRRCCCVHSDLHANQ